jgi:HEPN domain-containing protein
MNRKDLRRLARIRLEEARVLLRAGCWSGAYYLCGYAAECALKACIAKETKRSEFPDLERVRDSYTHKLPSLVIVAGLKALLDAERASDPAFDDNWITATDWSEKDRYVERSEPKARGLYRAITDRKHGVMRWIRQYW